MRRPVLLLALVVAGCGSGKTVTPTTTAPPPSPPPPPATTTAPTTTEETSTIRPTGDAHIIGEFEYEENGLCALTDEKTREGQPPGTLALCIMREEEGIPFITCSAFASPSDRAGKELEFHGFPGAQKLPDPENWTVPGCEAAAKKAAPWLVRHLAAS